MVLQQGVTLPKTFLDKVCGSVVHTISTSTSGISDNLSAYKGYIITKSSKSKKDVFFVDLNLGNTFTLGTEIHSISYDGTFGLVNSFQVKPEKTKLLEIGYTCFEIITDSVYQTMVTSDDYTLGMTNPTYSYIFCVFKSSDNSYRYFKRVRNIGVSLSNFTEVQIDDFYDILKVSPTDTNNKTVRTAYVYKCKTEKAILTQLNCGINNDTLKDNICKEDCKGGTLDELIQAFMCIQLIEFIIQRKLLLVGSSTEYFTDEEKKCIESNIDMLNSFDCCNEEKCSSC